MSQHKSTLFLLDAYALIFRAYFAFAKNPRVTSTGLDTSAIYGFTTTLLDLIAKEKPSHLAVVFDMEGPTIRHEVYQEYKANRDETPEGIKIAVPYIKQILKAMHIPTLGVAGYEADDVIGTLAYQAADQGYEVMMMTPDKDFGQLVRDNIKMYKPGRGGNPNEIWGIAEVCEKFDIANPSLVIDMLGMMGDAVDNIPGIPGVGEKTASKLLKEYGSLENVLANADKIKGKLGEKVAANKEQALLSKQLATILTDAPLQFDEKEYLLDPPNITEVEKVFTELEFRTLSKRFLDNYGADKNEPKVNSPAQKSSNELNEQLDLFATGDGSQHTVAASGYLTLTDLDHHYQLIADVVGLRQLAKVLKNKSSFCFDTETSSLEAQDAQLYGMAISYEKGKAFYIQFPDSENEIHTWLGHLQEVFRDENITKIAQNLKYDLSVLVKYDFEISGPTFDTMLAHYIINPDMRHNMDILAETYLNYKPISIEELIGKKGKNQKNMSEVPIEKVVEYACEDADITYQLAQIFIPLVKERGGEKVLYEVELPLVPVLSAMELEGINLDTQSLNEQSKELGESILQLEKEVYELCGMEFNLGSPKQLGEVLFDRLKIGGKPKKTKTGQYATGEDVLQNLIHEHEVIPKLLEYRQLTKLKSTYVDALPALVHPKTGRIHTHFNQAVAATGRLSSNNPNLQNIPIRTEKGRKIREAFVPSKPEHVILAADYSQIELRIIAEMSGEQTMLEAFKNQEDIHASTAAKIFKVDLKEVTREQRSNAKTVNFGIIYGVSAFGLSQQTNLSRSEAAKVIESYFETYPGIKAYMDQQVQFARKYGYVETLTGRRRYLADIDSRNQVVRGHSERNAINAPIQGSAADIIKIAMINVHKKLKNSDLRCKMLLQVHDELVFDVHQEDVEKAKDLILNEMIQAYNTTVPLVVEAGIGANWLQAH